MLTTVLLLLSVCDHCAAATVVLVLATVLLLLSVCDHCAGAGGGVPNTGQVQDRTGSGDQAGQGTNKRIL